MSEENYSCRKKPIIHVKEGLPHSVMQEIEFVTYNCKL